MWCDDNCSFVSGEGSAAAWLVAAVALTPAPLRTVLLPGTLAYGMALSLNRLAFGGHFLSDVLLSWSLTFLVTSLLYAAMRPVLRRGRKRATAPSRPQPVTS